MPLISITASKSSTRAAPPVLAAGDAIQLFVNKKSRDEKAGVKMKSVDGKLWIEEVIPGGLMEQAGARVNDRIQFINGHPAKRAPAAAALFDESLGEFTVDVERPTE